MGIEHVLHFARDIEFFSDPLHLGHNMLIFSGQCLAHTVRHVLVSVDEISKTGGIKLSSQISRMKESGAVLDNHDKLRCKIYRSLSQSTN